MEEKELFITKPSNMRIWHIFDGHRSLCCRVMMWSIDKEQCEKVTGNETYKKGQDCKMCFKKAGLNVDVETSRAPPAVETEGIRTEDTLGEEGIEVKAYIGRE